MQLSKPRARTWPRLAILLILLAVASCSACHSPKYVGRVFWHRGADYSDIEKFPASEITAATAASELPIALDPDVTALLDSHPKIEDFERFLESTETTAFLVVRDGTLVMERYFRGNTLESMQNTFSCSKSFMSAVIGLAVRDGAVDLEAPVTRYLPELEERDPRFAQIQVADLLYMRSGIKYSRDTSFPFVNADDALIYYHPNLESTVLGRTKIASEPGDFQYNNYNPPLLGLILRRTTGVSVSAYLERELWGPMGAMASAGWTVDDHGVERMESGFHARARDLARFGLLYLRRGFVDDRPVVPAEWIDTTTGIDEPVELDKYDGRSWYYGGGWWIMPRPNEPHDYCAIGAKGQYIYVSPGYEVVFIRNGPGKGEWGDFDWVEFFYSNASRIGRVAPDPGEH